MARAGDKREQELPGVERLLTLSDGVVAIALTLLVLGLQVPVSSDLRQANSASDLASFLSSTKIGDQLSSYVVSFFVIGSFWLAHHRAFRLVRGHDEGLAWWNFAYLFAITLVPFTSNVQGRLGENPLAAAMFSANLLLASLSTQAVVTYARRRGLMVRDADPRELAAGRMRSIGMTVVMVISTAVAWVSVDTSKYLLLLLIVVARASSWWGARGESPASTGSGSAAPVPGDQ